MDGFDLTPEQEVEAQRIATIVMEATRQDILQMARVMASKEDRHLLGQSEFEVRDICHRIGANVVETALEGRKKRGTKGRA